MSEFYSPACILIGFVRLADTWARIVGREAWSELEGIIDAKLETLALSQDKKQQEVCSLDLLNLLRPYPEALARLQLELIFVRKQWSEDKEKMRSFLQDETWGQSEIDDSIAIVLLFEPGGETNKQVTFKDTLGRGGAVTRKVGNIELNFRTIAPVVGRALPIFLGASPIVVWTTLLVTLPLISVAMRKEITEREATVFWGCVMAKDEDDIAVESDIIRCTNDDRKLAGFRSLSKNEIQIALQKLVELKCLKQTNSNTWKILESYSIEF